MATSKMDIKHKPLSISEEMHLNKQSGWHSKCPVKENSWRTRSFLQERLLVNAWMVRHKWECVMTAANETNWATIWQYVLKKSNVCINFQSYTLESFSHVICQIVHFRKCLKRIAFYTHTHTHFVFLTYPYNTLILSLQTIQITQSIHSRIIAVYFSPYSLMIFEAMTRRWISDVPSYISVMRASL